ncbi:MAG: hypothetical protein ACYDEF_05390 [Methanosarcina sp.]
MYVAIVDQAFSYDSDFISRRNIISIFNVGCHARSEAFSMPELK